jgi:metal-responsive CopG/Arc/MetJ family transcriptional regulator
MASENFNIYMDKKLKKELKKVAIDEDTSASEIISELVKEYLKNKRKFT